MSLDDAIIATIFRRNRHYHEHITLYKTMNKDIRQLNIYDRMSIDTSVRNVFTPQTFIDIKSSVNEDMEISI